MSLKLGRLSRNPEEACNQHLFFDTAIPSVIIVSAKMGHKERCPLVGKYALVNNNIQSITLQEQPGKYNIFGLGTMYFCCCHPFKGLTYFFLSTKTCLFWDIVSHRKSVHFAMKNIIKCFCFLKVWKNLFANGMTMAAARFKFSIFWHFFEALFKKVCILQQQQCFLQWQSWWEVISKIMKKVFFSEDSKTCVPGKNYQDHLMFGCTGEGTEFTVVQQNCVNQAKTTSSGK